MPFIAFGMPGIEEEEEGRFEVQPVSKLIQALTTCTAFLVRYACFPGQEREAVSAR